MDMKDDFDIYGEQLKGMAKLAHEAGLKQWAAPKSGQLAAWEFESWAKDHSPEEVRNLLAHVKEFVEAIGGSWDKLGQPPQNEVERKQYETICLFAMAAWRMRQIQDLQPRFQEATSKLAELQGPEQDMQKARDLMRQLVQGVEASLALPEAETPQEEPETESQSEESA